MNKRSRNWITVSPCMWPATAYTTYLSQSTFLSWRSEDISTIALEASFRLVGRETMGLARVLRANVRLQLINQAIEVELMLGNVDACNLLGLVIFWVEVIITSGRKFFVFLRQGSLHLDALWSCQDTYFFFLGKHHSACDMFFV